MAPFLTIVTRCCKRPNMLAVNIRSVLDQLDKDIEQVFVVDKVGKGLPWANAQVALNAHRVDGQYVYILDDDTKLVNDAFVAKLRRIAKGKPGVVMVKSRRPQFAPKLLPKADAWGKIGGLRLGATNCLCYVVRADLWKANAHRWNVPAAGDWNFLKGLLREDFVWLDMVVAETQQLGWMKGRRGGASFEGCGKDWWKRTVKRFGIVNRGKGDWRLPLWERVK